MHYKVDAAQVSMTHGGAALPGDRSLYAALLHPTLG